jgi:hypothetical protein
MKPLSADLETTILNMMADKNAQPAPAGIEIEPLELDLPEIEIEQLEFESIAPPGTL